MNIIDIKDAVLALQLSMTVKDTDANVKLKVLCEFCCAALILLVSEPFEWDTEEDFELYRALLDFVRIANVVEHNERRLATGSIIQAEADSLMNDFGYLRNNLLMLANQHGGTYTVLET